MSRADAYRAPDSVFTAGTIWAAAETGSVPAVKAVELKEYETNAYPALKTLTSADGILGATCLHIAAERGHFVLVKVGSSTAQTPAWRAMRLVDRIIDQECPLLHAARCST